MNERSATPVYTIGYGSRTFPEFAWLLKENGVEYLIDVRSSPYSRYSLDFVRERLKLLLAAEGIRYVFMGDVLGGRPDDPSCYRDGKVDYRLVAEKKFFQGGIERIEAAVAQNLTVALMCSEAKPHECHRSKLIGRVLEDRKIDVIHIDECGHSQTQDRVMARLQPQHSFFEADTSFQSRKRYQTREEGAKPSPWPRVVTIGAYGFDEDRFFEALRRASVDVFCDLRMRRGMRGSSYAFANSERLQQRLAEMGIRYVHRKDLAPDADVRAQQAAADQESGTGKRSRTSLSPEFRQAYEVTRMRDFDAEAFLREIGPNARTVALFCVEREPDACHRSLVAHHIERELGVHIDHLRP
jgi:uncharacterized protein (DUF488 family)